MKSSQTYISYAFCLGQHVAHEIVDTSRPGCPPEYMNIRVPEGQEDQYNYKYIPFTRSNYHSDSGTSPNTPRQQVRTKISLINSVPLHEETCQFLADHPTTNNLVPRAFAMTALYAAR